VRVTPVLARPAACPRVAGALGSRRLLALRRPGCSAPLPTPLVVRLGAVRCCVLPLSRAPVSAFAVLIVPRAELRCTVVVPWPRPRAPRRA
jgi:hypothetical protein